MEQQYVDVYKRGSEYRAITDEMKQWSLNPRKKKTLKQHLKGFKFIGRMTHRKFIEITYGENKY